VERLTKAKEKAKKVCSSLKPRWGEKDLLYPPTGG